MKLAAHYNRANIIITVTVLIVGAIIYFFSIKYIARTQLDRNLTEEIEEVEDYVKANHQLPKQVDFDEDQTLFVKTDKKQIQRIFFDTTYINPKEKRIEPGRAVSGLIRLRGLNYKVIITVSRESTEYLIQFIAIITLGLVIGLLLILFLTNRYVLNGLWKPFYDLLHQIKAFNISEDKSFRMNNNKVNEFAELSVAIDTMSSRVRYDYQNLKHFTDNASHEMLTPLAVITSKLDTLIQNESLPPDIYEQIDDIYAAAGKLSRLNQTLLLLTKIENNLIEDNEFLDIGALISAKHKQFQELILAKNIQCTENLNGGRLLVSKYLMDILLNNLLSNAIRHNINLGKILITLTDRQLIFNNTSSSDPLNANTIFERFQKGNKSEGTGLGLTIVQNICRLYDWNILYNYKDDFHTFQITF